MDLYIIILRLSHIGGAVAWVGFSAFMLFIFEPIAKAAGPEGQRFQGRLMGNSRFPIAISVSAVSTTLSGILLYIRDSGGLNMDWMKSGTGLVFTIGGIAGIAAAVIGAAVLGPLGGKLGRLAKEIADAGKPPSQEQASALQEMDARLKRAERIDVAIMMVALLAMAVARYVPFAF